jgi:hypothetical protein
MIVARFKITRVWTINGQSHAELKGDDGSISFHRPASDNLTEGQEFVLRSVEAAKQVPLLNLNQKRLITLEEPQIRDEVRRSRKDLLSD